MTSTLSDGFTVPGDPSDAARVAPPPSEAALAAGLVRLRRRTGLAVTNRWLLLGGAVLLPLGIVLVVAGWYGAAHTTRLFEEVPYLISGGMFGIVLVIIGAALYFGFWMTHLVHTDREILDVLRRIEGHLATGETAPRPDAAAARGTAGAAVQSAAGTAGARDAGAFVVTRTGTMYHRPDCPVVADRPRRELRVVTLPAAGLSACKLCNPAS